MKLSFIIFLITGLISCGTNPPKPPTYYGKPRIPVNQMIPQDIPAPVLNGMIPT